MQLRVHGLGTVAEHAHDLLGLGPADHDRTLLDGCGFFLRDGGEAVPEVFAVIESDRGHG